MARPTVVLLGGGHAHIQVLLRAPAPANTVLLSDSAVAVYSGMLPAALAGLVPPSRAHVHLPSLCAHYGVRFVHARVFDVRPLQKQVLYRDISGEVCVMSYDVLSVNVGSRTLPVSVYGQSLQFPAVVKTRPILQLAPAVTSFEHLARERGITKPRVVVIGGGAAGIEIVLALEARFRRFFGEVDCVLVSKSEAFAQAFGRCAGYAVEAELRKRGVRYLIGTSVRFVDKEKGIVKLDDDQLEFDCAVVATGAAPHEWLGRSGLETDEDGWVVVDEKLRVGGRDDIFAVGDCITVPGVPKAGVYAVREGPVLAHNLNAVVGGGTLKSFKPQGSFLSLLSTGIGGGIGSKWGLVFKGNWVYRLKSYIDESWQRRFRVEDGKEGKEVEMFQGDVAEGAAVLQAAEDVQIGDGFEGPLSVLKRMDSDEQFRDAILKTVRKD